MNKWIKLDIMVQKPDKSIEIQAGHRIRISDVSRFGPSADNADYNYLLMKNEPAPIFTKEKIASLDKLLGVDDDD